MRITDPFQNLRGFPKKMTRKRRWLIIRTYLPDWILTILLWGLFYLLDKVEGFRRTFSIEDTSLDHSSSGHHPPRLPHRHSELLGSSLGLAWTSSESLGNEHSYQYPQDNCWTTQTCLIDRCQPLPGLINPTPYTLSDTSICARTDLLSDGFQSFPSGHSSLSFCGMIYLTFYLAAKMHVSNQQGFSWKTWVLLAPISGAVLAAVSRSMDSRHPATDIIAGSLISLIIG